MDRSQCKPIVPPVLTDVCFVPTVTEVRFVRLRTTHGSDPEGDDVGSFPELGALPVTAEFIGNHDRVFECTGKCLKTRPSA